MKPSLAPLVILAIAWLAPSNANATGATAVLAPPHGDGLDTVTLEIIESTLLAKLEESGWTPVDPSKVRGQIDMTCGSAGCNESSQIVQIGQALGAQIVITVEIAKKDDEITVRVFSVMVDTGATEQAAASTTASGVLAKVVGLMKVVVPDPFSQPAGPEVQPLAPPAAPEPSLALPAPPSAPTPEPAQPGPEPAGPAPIVPGAELPDALDQPTGESKDGEPNEDDQPAAPRDQSGRVDIAISSTIYAMLMTFTIMYAVDEDIDWYWYPPAMLLSGGVALTASLLITWKLRVTSGDAAMFDACLGWGTGNGTLIPLAMGKLDARPILVGTVIGGGIGLAGGILAASLFDPTPGDAALASASASWGSAFAAMITGMVQPTSFEPYIIASLVGMDVALAAGIVASIFVDVEPRTIGLATLGGTLGGLLGATVGLPFVIKDNGPSTNDLRGYVGMIFGFSALGLTLGIVIPAALDRKKKNKMSSMPFLVAHDESGWGMGVPGLMLVPPVEGLGTTYPGAQIGLAGGVF